MAVRIRLSRIGKKKAPFHTVVVTDSRKKRDGAIIENIGTYDGLNARVVLFNEPSYAKWVACGAQPTDSVKKIYKLYKASGAATVQSVPVEAPQAKPKGRAPKKAQPVDAASESAQVKE